MDIAQTTSYKLKNFHNGNEYKAYEFFGCHNIDYKSFVFRVWAPRADCVFLEIDGRRLEMCRLDDNESFEVTTTAKEGDTYNFVIKTKDGRELFKCDPYAFRSDFPNSFKSVVSQLPKRSNYSAIFNFQDKNQPVNIYEVNLLSWKRHKDNSYYTFSDLTKELVPYVKEMGYTHIEFMPITEYPFDGSWGYQVTGYFSVVSRLGSLQDFKNLIDAFHSQGIKVIIDWVPAHFPKDDWALYEFDGSPLYESPLWDRMEHKGWGTRRFDFGRGEVDSFLISSANFFFDIYGIDGLRVDAVASMIYLDYDRAEGDYTPNIYGDNRNLEGIEFLKKFNRIIKSNYPGAITVAEESTAFPNVTKHVEEGGLGFDYKWNMGWMNDVLFYCRQDPYFRSYHHQKLTFSLVYAFSENFILPLSHDEVVHVKGSIVNKMSGEYADKFCGERLLLAYMYAHPGKKLNFMGYEIAQFSEWNYNSSIEYFLKDEYELHGKIHKFVKDLNNLYISYKPLYEIDDSWDGFKWLVVDDSYNNLVAFSRYSKSGQTLVAVFNFSGIDIKGYNVEVDKGKYRCIFNTDNDIYGGSGKIKKKLYSSVNQTGIEDKHFLNLNIPRLTCMYFIKEK